TTTGQPGRFTKLWAFPAAGKSITSRSCSPAPRAKKPPFRRLFSSSGFGFEIFQALLVGGLHLFFKGQGGMARSHGAQQIPREGRVVDQQGPQQVGAEKVLHPHPLKGTPGVQPY